MSVCALSAAPVLLLKEPALLTRLTTNVSEVVTSAVLEQLVYSFWNLIAFKSSKLVPAEACYSPHILELLAVTRVLKAL